MAGWRPELPTTPYLAFCEVSEVCRRVQRTVVDDEPGNAPALRDSSPYRRKISASSSADKLLIKSAAVSPVWGSNRISSGPSFRKENPRFPSSIAATIIPGRAGCRQRGKNPVTCDGAHFGVAVGTKRSPKGKVVEWQRPGPRIAVEAEQPAGRRCAVARMAAACLPAPACRR